MNREPLSPVAAELRAVAPERFLCTLFAPLPARDAMMALYAFEAATLRAVRSGSALAGLGRIAFWRDVIDGAAAPAFRPPANPVAAALTAAIRQHRLPAEEFQAHLDVREAMLNRDQLPDMEGLAAEARDAALPLLRLGCAILVVRPPAEVPAIAEMLGLVELLRAAVGMARAGRLVLPADLASAAGFGLQSLAELRNTERIAPVMAKVAERARTKAGQGVTVARRAVPALLPVVPARDLLRALAAADHAPEAAMRWQPTTATRLRILWAAISCRL